MHRMTRHLAVVTTVTYLTFSVLWILLSDRMLAALIPDAADLTVWQTLKGWLFVAISGVLIITSIAGTRPLRSFIGNRRCEIDPRRFSARRMRTPFCASGGKTPMMRGRPAATVSMNTTSNSAPCCR